MSLVNVKEAKCREEVNRKTGQVFYRQRVALQQGAYELPFDVPVPDAASVYPVGTYTLHPDSFRVNQWGGLELNRFDLRLRPVTKAAQPQPQAK